LLDDLWVNPHAARHNRRSANQFHATPPPCMKNAPHFGEGFLTDFGFQKGGWGIFAPARALLSPTSGCAQAVEEGDGRTLYRMRSRGYRGVRLRASPSMALREKERLPRGTPSTGGRSLNRLIQQRRDVSWTEPSVLCTRSSRRLASLVRITGPAL